MGLELFNYIISQNSYVHIYKLLATVIIPTVHEEITSQCAKINRHYAVSHPHFTVSGFGIGNTVKCMKGMFVMSFSDNLNLNYKLSYCFLYTNAHFPFISFRAHPPEPAVLLLCPSWLPGCKIFSCYESANMSSQSTNTPTTVYYMMRLEIYREKTDPFSCLYIE